MTRNTLWMCQHDSISAEEWKKRIRIHQSLKMSQNSQRHGESGSVWMSMKQQQPREEQSSSWKTYLLLRDMQKFNCFGGLWMVEYNNESGSSEMSSVSGFKCVTRGKDEVRIFDNFSESQGHAHKVLESHLERKKSTFKTVLIKLGMLEATHNNTRNLIKCIPNFPRKSIKRMKFIISFNSFAFYGSDDGWRVDGEWERDESEMRKNVYLWRERISPIFHLLSCSPFNDFFLPSSHSRLPLGCRARQSICVYGYEMAMAWRTEARECSQKEINPYAPQ